MILNYPDSRGWTETGAGAEVGKLEYLASIDLKLENFVPTEPVFHYCLYLPNDQ